MAAPLSTPTTRDLEAALQCLREAVEHFDGAGAQLNEWRVHLDKFCALARRENVPPEQVLVGVKWALDGLPHRHPANPNPRDVLRNRIVAMAIAAYYSESPRDVR